jgi:hypothetical protein
MPEPAVLADMDPQKSTQVWKRLRAQDEILPKLSIGTCRPARLPPLLRELRSWNMRWNTDRDLAAAQAHLSGS